VKSRRARDPGGLVRRLAETARAGAQPTRAELREVLVLLGEQLLAGELAPAEALANELLAALAPLEPGWRAVLAEELELAAAEHVQGVDARYLDLPGYDFDYAISARERLEARFAAAAALGSEPPEALVARVRERDRLLESALERRGRA
jgi:hypothetical protein